MLCKFDQIRLPKKIAKGILAGTLIYGALVIYFYWDSTDEEFLSIGLALALLVILLRGALSLPRLPDLRGEAPIPPAPFPHSVGEGGALVRMASKL